MEGTLFSSYIYLDFYDIGRHSSIRFPLIDVGRYCVIRSILFARLENCDVYVTLSLLIPAILPLMLRFHRKSNVECMILHPYWIMVEIKVVVQEVMKRSFSNLIFPKSQSINFVYVVLNPEFAIRIISLEHVPTFYSFFQVNRCPRSESLD